MGSYKFEERDKALIGWAYLQGAIDQIENKVHAPTFIALAEIEMGERLQDAEEKGKES